ncbi:autophagy-related protein 13 [Entomortierella parvispora]|uniref:Autophagy-related protein 13 n=1 Tax=Entomortierella parvispora TaxID=205924 RepID=A0A9P3H3D2_9FUNG|nr:autophagy-related protein 13 [Entomortierella parvispora]
MSSRRSSSSSSSRPDSPALFSAFAQAHSHSQQQLQLRPPHQAQASQPQQPPPPPRNQKADHILQNFYVKVIQIVVLARVTHPDPSAGAVSRKGSLRGAPLVRKTSKWFNLELEDLDIYKEDAKFWRAMAITESPPAMLVELLLDTSELAPNQMLMLVDESNRRKRVEIGPSSTATTPLGQSRSRRNIILESWSLTQSNTPPDPAPEPPVVYKKSIIFFRSLYAYMRLLPAYQLYKRLRKQNLPLKIGFRVSRGQPPEESMFRDSDIGIEVPLIEGETRPNLSEYRFGQVETPLGAFSLKVTYRSNCEFHVDESEASMIYRFNDMDENYFTPTIVTHSQESVKSSGRPSFDGRRPTAPSPLPRRSSSDLYNSGNYQDQFAPLQTLGHRRSSIQSFQQRSGEYSSSQSSVSSLGARGTRRESSGPGSLFTSIDAQNPGSTPPFSTHGGNSTGSRTGADAILESPPLKLGTGSQRPLSSNFSPFKTPSLSSSPSPSYLEPVSSSLSSRPPSIKMGRSPSTSSMSRVQSSQLGSGLLSSTQRTGSATPTQSVGPSNLQSGGTAMLSSSVKSNASSSTSAPRVASIFSHRHDGRRSSSESLPGGRNRGSIIGASSLFQFTPDDDDVSSFVRMLDTPEPLKMFGKTSGSTTGPSFGFGESSLTSSALKTKSTLDRFQQLKQVNADLSDSMSASQILSKEQGQQSSSYSRPSGSSNLTITTGYLSRRSTLSDIGTTSPTGTAIPLAISRHSQSLSHQPGTPSPLHSEVPLYPLTSSGQTRPSSSSVHQHASGHSRTGSTPTKRFSWLLGADGSHGKGTNMGSIAFRHGSLDQGKDIFGMDEAMGRIGISSPTEVAFGSFPEDVHHQQSRYSAPLQTGRETSEHNVTSGADPRPIPSSAHSGATSSRPSGRLLRLGSGSSGTSFTLPRLRSRAGDDNESLNDVASTSNARGHQHGERSEGQFEGDDEEEEDEEEDDQDDSRSEELRPSQEEKRDDNTSLNDDDDMLFIMSELSPGSTPATQYQSFSTGANVVYPGAGGTAAFLPSSAPTERGMMPLTGAMMNLRSQSQSPAMGPHGSPYHPSSGNGGPASTSSSPHYRLFGRNAPMSGSVFSNNGNNGNSSRSNSVSHSRGGSNSGSNTNGQNSVENLHLLRRSFSGSGIEDGPGLSPSMTANLRLGAAPPLLPPLPPAVTPGATSYPYDGSILEGRRMSRTGSDRGVPTGGVHSRRTSGSGVNSNGHNSFHSDHRSGQREGW